MRGRRAGKPRRDEHPVFGDRSDCNMCDLEWYFLDLTPQQRETVRDECKEAQTRNNKQWTEFLGDGQMTRVEPKEGAHPKDHLVDFLLEYAHPGNAVCLGAASLVGDQGGVGALDNTIAVRKGRFFSQKNDPLVQRMRGLDLREPGMLLLGYEVRMAGKNDWTPEEWGTKPVELHALPNNRLVGQGLMHVQAYPGFVCLTVLTDEADSSLNAMCRVAKKEDLLVDDLLAVVQYDVNTWAFTPPVVAVVRTRSFLCECVCAEGRQFENCHPSDDEVERKDTERLTFHDATDVGVVAPALLDMIEDGPDAHFVFDESFVLSAADLYRAEPADDGEGERKEEEPQEP